jgi:acyl-CoA thioesterase
MSVDGVLAFACNYHGPPAMPPHCPVVYVAPRRLGPRLVAEPRERHRANRGGFGDVTLTTLGSELIGAHRGHCRKFPASLLESATPSDEKSAEREDYNA